jgi:hypothetical protein
MNHNVQDLLRKINYIEADIEIQKQILFSTPTNEEKELEKVITVIAQKKDMITELREEIKKIDPAEYEYIMLFEEASKTFRKLAAEKKFTSIESMTNESECFLTLKDSTKIPCLIKASEKNGNYTIMTLTGEIKHFESSEVDETKITQPD